MEIINPIITNLRYLITFTIFRLKINSLQDYVMNLVSIFGRTNDSAKVLLVLTHLPEELQNKDLRLGDQKRDQIMREFEEECPAVLSTGGVVLTLYGITFTPFFNNNPIFGIRYIDKTPACHPFEKSIKFSILFLTRIIPTFRRSKRIASNVSKNGFVSAYHPPVF